MRIGFTINLGNYENMKIESNDLPTLEDCLLEIYHSLQGFATDDFYLDKFLQRDYFIFAREMAEGSK